MEVNLIVNITSYLVPKVSHHGKMRDPGNEVVNISDEFWEVVQ